MKTLKAQPSVSAVWSDAGPESNQLAGVNDVFNAVLMQGDMLGDVVFYGKGAWQAAHRQRRCGRRH